MYANGLSHVKNNHFQAEEVLNMSQSYVWWSDEAEISRNWFDLRQKFNILITSSAVETLEVDITELLVMSFKNSRDDRIDSNSSSVSMNV